MRLRGMVARWRGKVGRLRTESYALYLAYRDPRVPWYAKAFAALVVGYAFSPIDLVPDFIPVLGYVDDLILVPFGIVIALKMIPGEVMEECRVEAREALRDGRPVNWAAAVGASNAGAGERGPSGLPVPGSIAAPGRADVYASTVPLTR